MTMPSVRIATSPAQLQGIGRDPLTEERRQIPQPQPQEGSSGLGRLVFQGQLVHPHVQPLWEVYRLAEYPDERRTPKGAADRMAQLLIQATIKCDPEVFHTMADRMEDRGIKLDWIRSDDGRNLGDAFLHAMRTWNPDHFLWEVPIFGDDAPRVSKASVLFSELLRHGIIGNVQLLLKENSLHAEELVLMIEWLLKESKRHGDEIPPELRSVKDSKGNTLAHHAAIARHAGLRKLLTNAELYSSDIRNKDGKTPQVIWNEPLTEEQSPNWREYNISRQTSAHQRFAIERAKLAVSKKSSSETKEAIKLCQKYKVDMDKIRNPEGYGLIHLLNISTTSEEEINGKKTVRDLLEHAGVQNNRILPGEAPR